MQKLPIRKAVFPVAGLGTRFLPATKVHPKEMLPIVDKPLIQHAVQEAIDAGIKQLIFVTSSSKRAIEDHFDLNHELEFRLAEQGKYRILNSIRNIIPKGVECVYIRQAEPKGLGNAVLCAKEVVGNEYFAVLLADDLINTKGVKTNCLQQMLANFNEGNMLAVQHVIQTEINKYGIIDNDDNSETVSKVKCIVEKPKLEDAPSNLAVVGRYILHPNIFSHIERLLPDNRKEVQLTDAIASLLKYQSVYSYKFKGTRFDCGTKLGYLRACIAYGLEHEEIGKEFEGEIISLANKLQENYKQIKDVV